MKIIETEILRLCQRAPQKEKNERRAFCSWRYVITGIMQWPTEIYVKSLRDSTFIRTKGVILFFLACTRYAVQICRSMSWRIVHFCIKVGIHMLADGLLCKHLQLLHQDEIWYDCFYASFCSYADCVILSSVCIYVAW